MRQEERLTSFCFLQCKTQRCIDRNVAVFVCADWCSKLEGGVGEFFGNRKTKSGGIQTKIVDQVFSSSSLGSLGASDRKRKHTTKQNERRTCRLLLVLFSDHLPFLCSSSLSFLMSFSNERDFLVASQPYLVLTHSLASNLQAKKWILFSSQGQ